MTYHIGDEVVNGTIIGGDHHIGQKRYKFYTTSGDPITYQCHWFDDDAQAEAWFKDEHPEHYRKGAEMRVWD